MKCKYCDKEFFDPKHSNRKYCSRKCSGLANKKHDLSGRNCIICNQTFIPHRPSQKYCSSQCYGQNNRYSDAICQVCNKPFRYISSSKNRFCSYKCTNIARQTGYYKNCEVCNNSFWVTPTREKNGAYTCSKECGYKRRRSIFTCEYCNKTVETSSYIVKNKGRFCSYDCAAKWQKGANHSNWQGGHDRWRGPNWIKQKHKARKRDNYTCQNCGITEKELDRPMDVHHIIPWRKFNHDWQEANKLDNLISYCPKCHTTIERNQSSHSHHSI